MDFVYIWRGFPPLFLWNVLKLAIATAWPAITNTYNNGIHVPLF